MTQKGRWSGIGLMAVLWVGIIRAPETCAATSAQTFCVQTDPQAKAHCRLVLDFHEAFFNRHQVKAAETAIGAAFIDHHPGASNGRRALVEGFTAYFREHAQASSQIVHVSVSGDLVWLHVHDCDAPADRGDAVVDIYRVQAGRIVEHWDVIQPIPAEAKNSMF